MNTIDKQSRIPYYYQLAEILKEIIQQRSETNETEALPSENDLTANYQVSRATVRRALGLLEREGLIYRAKGKGTFIARHHIKYPLTRMIATTEDILRRGWAPRITVLSVEEMDTHPPITEALGIAPSDRIYKLCRLWLADGEPVSLQWTYLPVKICPGLIHLDLTQSLTQQMEEKFGILFWSAHERLRAKLPAEYEARQLQISAETPVIYMERTTFTPEGHTVEFLQSVWRCDKYEFEFTLSRSKT